jgi:aldehyde:ferredoxin oxidoreductase
MWWLLQRPFKRDSLPLGSRLVVAAIPQSGILGDTKTRGATGRRNLNMWFDAIIIKCQPRTVYLYIEDGKVVIGRRASLGKNRQRDPKNPHPGNGEDFHILTSAPHGRIW